MKKILAVVFLATGLFHSPLFAGMPDSYDGMPQLKEKKVYKATGKENWDMTTGFGAHAAMNDMMNQMMVGGSGMEGMKMNMSESTGSTNDSMKISDNNNMEGMDMSDDSGMKGMDMEKSKKKPADKSSIDIKASLQTEPPKVGHNLLTFTVIDKATDKPLEKLKITAKVFMTSMDMGTAEPQVEELGKGRYQVKVGYAMAGPWRVELNVTVPGQKPVVKNLDYDVQMPD